MATTRVHRCRFLDHVPHAIESLDVDPSCQRLAVLRANADIEVWSLKRGEPHFCEFRIAGAVDVPVRRVAWGARSPRQPAGRLFTCGLHGLITEWDLRTLSPRASWDSAGGAAWTMDVHVASRTMAVGCEDGGCSVFDMTEDDVEPTLRHRTPPQGGRLLGVALSPQGSHLACSAADGTNVVAAFEDAINAAHVYANSDQEDFADQVLALLNETSTMNVGGADEQPAAGDNAAEPVPAS